MAKKWSKFEEKSLARFVIPELPNSFKLPNHVNRLELIQWDKRQLVKEIYNALLKKNIKYALEPFNHEKNTQLIRTYKEILETRAEGTCLDLTLLFCGICLAYDLLPLLIVLEGHALAAVSMRYNRQEYWTDKSTERDEERQLFQDKPLTDYEKLKVLIDSGSFLSIECTGFVSSQTTLPENMPEGIGRNEEGFLSFERAIEAGKEQISTSGRKLNFALDIEIAQTHWEIRPQVKDDRYAINNLFLYFYSSKQSSNSQEQNRRDLLDAVKQEVEGRLDQTLHNSVLINLFKELQSKQVTRPWDVEVPIARNSQISPQTLIIDVFNQMAGKVLILGLPGSGKTTMLLELARELITRAENDIKQPIPILFNLSYWKNEQPIDEWLVDELKSRYGLNNLAREWLDKHLVMPLFDGLNELELKQQKLCINSINIFIKENPKLKNLVVSCREKEYKICKTKLFLNGAIYLQPLTKVEIQKYLERVGFTELWQNIETEKNLMNLAKTPLFLWVMTLTHESISIQEWQKLKTEKERCKYLFNIFIRERLQQPIKNLWYSEGKEPTIEQTLQWLHWLAQRLKEEHQTEFMLEKIQPNWLQDSNHKLIYKIIVGLILGIIYGIRTFIGMKIFFDLLFSINFGLFRFFVGLSIGLQSLKIEPVETLTFSFRKMRLAWKERSGYKEILWSISLIFIPGTLSINIFDFSPYWNNNYFTLEDFKLLFPIMWIFCLISWFLFFSLQGTELKLELRNRPNQGIWQSAKNMIIFALIMLPVFLIGWRVIFLILGKNAEFSYLVAILFAITYGMSFAGIPFIQHFILRLILLLNNYIPWKYVCFLNYATQLKFLQKIGGRYSFIHPLLQEHFANIEVKKIVSE